MIRKGLQGASGTLWGSTRYRAPPKPVTPFTSKQYQRINPSQTIHGPFTPLHTHFTASQRTMQ